nr:hypothetical protein HmN_000765300 [Hymenolepis microstoma]
MIQNINLSIKALISPLVDFSYLWVSVVVCRAGHCIRWVAPFPPEGHIVGMLVERILLFREDVLLGNRVRLAMTLIKADMMSHTGFTLSPFPAEDRRPVADCFPL